MLRKMNDQPIGDVLQKFVSSYKHKPKLHQTKIVKSWKRIMGPTISGYTKEIYVSKGRLFIKIDSAPLRQELSYAKDKIRNILNEEIGENYIQDVVIR